MHWSLPQQWYGANSILSLTNVIHKPGLFYNLTRFECDIWIEKLFEPLEGKITWPRGYQYIIKSTRHMVVKYRCWGRDKGILCYMLADVNRWWYGASSLLVNRKKCRLKCKNFI